MVSKQLRKYFQTSSGFTLLELLIVITVLGVLSAIALLAVGNTSKTANLTACKTDVQTYASALQGWKNDFRSYYLPSTTTNVTLDRLVGDGYLSSQILADPKKSYSLAIVIGSGGTSAQVQISKIGGSSSGAFNVDSPTASADAECRKALGI